MSWATWWIFATTVFVLCGTPGPNMLHVMTRSLRFGPRRAVAAMAGCLTAILIGLVASASGLAALLTAWPPLFEALRYAGVAYLIYLGVMAWRGGGAPLDVGSEVGALPAHSLATLYRNGFLISLSNPKFLLFAAAFFPQFIDKTRPQASQFAILVTTFVVLEAFWYGVYALGGARLAKLLDRPALQRAFDRATGIVFLGFGLALLTVRA
jgi:threonine/homoserine/homoserine lactone efflux protein